MVDEFVGRVFNGSAQPLLVHLVGDQRIDPNELAEVEKLVKARRAELDMFGGPLSHNLLSWDAAKRSSSPRLPHCC